MTSSDRSVVFIINSLTAGGAERAFVSVISSMEDRLKGYTTHLVLLDTEEERHPVPHFVRKHVIDANFNWLKSAYSLMGLLKDLSPAVTLSFLNRANVANVISATILRHPCVISERSHTSSHFGGVAAPINRAIIRLIYPRADQVIAASHGIRTDLISNFGISEGKVSVIYNPVDLAQIERQASLAPSIDLPDAYILSVGRLVTDKNFPLLIKAYRAANLAEKLVIAGEGDQRGVLERLIADLGLTGRVLLPGHVQNPYPLMKAARLYVCSSDTEGFPNALIEAMALGCPVVSTDCDVGPREILQDAAAERVCQVRSAKWGILVPTGSVQALAETIVMALHPEVRSTYSGRGKERARLFSVDAAVGQYWSTLARYLDCR